MGQSRNNQLQCLNGRNPGTERQGSGRRTPIASTKLAWIIPARDAYQIHACCTMPVSVDLGRLIRFVDPLGNLIARDVVRANGGVIPGKKLPIADVAKFVWSYIGCIRLRRQIPKVEKQRIADFQFSATRMDAGDLARAEPLKKATCKKRMTLPALSMDCLRRAASRSCTIAQPSTTCPSTQCT